MRCPLCDVAMREVERRGVRIDVCPECRGIWLDRGELDKLLAAEPAGGWEDRGPAGEERRHDDDPRYDDERRYGEGYKRKKKGWLSEVFDFDLFD